MNYLLLLSVLIVVINLAVIGLGFLFGYRRGTGRSVVRLGYILVISFIAYFLAIAIAKPLSETVFSAIKPYFDTNETLQKYAQNSTVFESLIRGLISSILAPILLPIIFAIFQALSMIKFRFIADKLVKLVKKGGDPMTQKSRLIGGGIGMVQGFIIASALLVPLFVAHTIIATAEDNISGGTEAAIYAPEGTGMHSLSLNRPSVANNRLATGFFNFFVLPTGSQSLTHIVGSPYNLRTEGPLLLGAANTMLINSGGTGFLGGGGTDDGSDLTGSGGSSTDTNAIVALFASMIPYIEQSELLSDLAADLLNTAATIWESGESFLGVSFNTDNAIISNLLSSLIESLRNANPNNVSSILTTFFVVDESGESVIGGMIKMKFDSEILQDPGDSLDSLVDMLIAINSNPELSLIGESIGDIGKQLISEIDIPAIPAENTAVYEEIETALKSAINTMPSANSYKESVYSLSSEIVNISSSYNYEIEDAESKLISISLLSYFGSSENITVDGLKDYFGVIDPDAIEVGK